MPAVSLSPVIVMAVTFSSSTVTADVYSAAEALGAGFIGARVYPAARAGANPVTATSSVNISANNFFMETLPSSMVYKLPFIE